MGGIPPVEKEWIASKNIAEVRPIVSQVLQSRGGHIVRFNENRVECDFGSLLASRIIGELFVSKSTLPSKVEINFQPLQDDKTKLKLLVKDRHKFGFKWTFAKKYQEALLETAESIFALCKTNGI